jgi:glutaconate CoA-transferase subunit B
VTIAVDEQIAWCLARRCRPDDVLVVGVGQPLAPAAGQLARALLVPELVLIVAAAVNPAPHDVAEPLARPEMLADSSLGVFTQIEILDQIQRGRCTLQFLSPAQVDGAGNLNASRAGGRRLPGSLAIADVAGLIGRLVIYRAAHTPRFLPAEVEFLTGTGAHVEAIVTSKAVLARDGEGFRLESVHEGCTVEEVVEGCGFAIRVDGEVPTTEQPPADALRLLREVIDPHGVRRLETREGRAEALRTLEELSA